MSRAQTLVLALLVVHVLLGVLCLIIARGEHKSPALRWWGIGLLVYAAGLLVTIGGAILPAAFAAIAGNTLITIAPVPCAVGVLSHTPVRLRARWVNPAIVASVAALFVANLADYQRLAINMMAPTPIATVLFLLSAWAVGRQGPRDAEVACEFLSSMLVLAVATWLARIAAMLPLPGGTEDKVRIDGVVSFFAIAQMVVGVGATLALMWIDVRLMQAELSRVAHTDALTGLANRRAFLTRFQEELARAARHGQRFALALFDIDHFKQVNDRLGHAGGDVVLVAIATAFAAAKRSEDVLARIGGEEFVVLLAQQSREGAVDAAERLRHAVGSTELSGDGVDRVTVSCGLALYPDDGTDWDHLFAAADRRLYGAKRAGRNRVEANG